MGLQRVHRLLSHFSAELLAVAASSAAKTHTHTQTPTQSVNPLWVTQDPVPEYLSVQCNDFPA